MMSMRASENSSDMLAGFEQLVGALQQPYSIVKVRGSITSIGSKGISITGLSAIAKTGDLIRLGHGENAVIAEVIVIEPAGVLASPFGDRSALRLGDRAECLGPLVPRPDRSWKGRLISAMAEPIDGGPSLVAGAMRYGLNSPAPQALGRRIPGDKIPTGVCAIDVFTPLCYGQRVGVFAGSGVGKSTLLAMLAKSPGFDCAVIALVGERGREVTEFVEDVLGEARNKAVVVVSTGDEPAATRRMAPAMATSIAEYFRDQGDRVLLIMDSVTRFAHASREIAMASGEPPVSRGYPPSVFAALPRLLERAGPSPAGPGSITGIYAVLVDGDNHNEPVADAIRGTLDGHIVLDRDIAAEGRYPAVDILGSISRLADRAWSEDERKSVLRMRKLVSRYEETKDLRALGGYAPGQDLELDRALAFVPRLYASLAQGPGDPPCLEPFALVANATEPPRPAEGTSSAVPASGLR